MHLNINLNKHRFNVISLYFRYHDGYIAEDRDSTSIQMKKLFYPKYWLDATGFFNSKIAGGPGVILFASEQKSSEISLSFTAFSLLLATTALVSALAGACLSKRRPSNGSFMDSHASESANLLANFFVNPNIFKAQHVYTPIDTDI
jgi:hypothetical protein